MRWALNGSVAMNGREREGWEGVEGLQEGSKGLSYTDEWALASNHRVASLSNESEDATRKESTCKLIFTKRKGYSPAHYSKSALHHPYHICVEVNRVQRYARLCAVFQAELTINSTLTYLKTTPTVLYKTRHYISMCVGVCEYQTSSIA